MRPTILPRDPRPRRRLWPYLAVMAALLSLGCQAQEPPLSPAAALFKKEVKDCVNRLATALIQPVAAGNKAAILATLDKVEPETIKLCRMCPFITAVLNQQGDILATHPPRPHTTRNFADYKLVIKTINSKRIQQARFYLQNGQQLYIISVPLLQADRVIGIMAIAISAQEAKNRWDVTEKEFMTLDFNT
ncbi:MAG: hypothetical protein AB1491_06505 [Thermodesulfobacteriota bacterium]